MVQRRVVGGGKVTDRKNLLTLAAKKTVLTAVAGSKKRAQRRGSLLLFAVIYSIALLLCVPPPALADVNKEERRMLSAMMEERNMEPLVKCEELFDRFGEASFLMGTSTDGYLIMERSTGTFMEQGSRKGPYSANAQAKYYGGLGCYAEDDDRGLIDSRTGRTLDSVPYIPAVEEMVTERAGVQIGTDNGSSSDIGGSSTEMESIATVTSSKQLLETFGKIRGVAFGNNAGDYANTCSAVALSIALNYLDWTHDGRLVPSVYELEQRTEVDYDATEFAKATAFHHHLVNNCELSPWYIGDFTPGVWGTKLKSGFSSYLAQNEIISATDLEFDWELFPSSNWHQNSIDRNSPALITVAFSDWNNGEYNTHTMVVYGYRSLSDGSMEIAVHSGWYASECTESNEVFYMDEIWAPVDIASIIYHFSLSDGWHCSEAGDWRYYDDGSYVTGWRVISGDIYYFNSVGVRTTGYLTLGGVRYFFDSDGILVSQENVGSPSTGGSASELLAANTQVKNALPLPFPHEGALWRQ